MKFVAKPLQSNITTWNHGDTSICNCSGFVISIMFAFTDQLYRLCGIFAEPVSSWNGLVSSWNPQKLLLWNQVNVQWMLSRSSVLLTAILNTDSIPYLPFICCIVFQSLSIWISWSYETFWFPNNSTLSLQVKVIFIVIVSIVLFKNSISMNWSERGNLIHFCDFYISFFWSFVWLLYLLFWSITVYIGHPRSSCVPLNNWSVPGDPSMSHQHGENESRQDWMTGVIKTLKVMSQFWHQECVCLQGIFCLEICIMSIRLCSTFYVFVKRQEHWGISPSKWVGTPIVIFAPIFFRIWWLILYLSTIKL